MARRLTGVIFAAAKPSIVLGGAIRFDELIVADESGTRKSLGDMTMEREVAELLRPGTRVTLYLSDRWSTIYGVCPRDGPGRFHSTYANPLMLLMSIGLLFGGLATSVFVFPIIIALLGLVGVMTCLDARTARKLFRNDSRRPGSDVATD